MNDIKTGEQIQKEEDRKELEASIKESHFSIEEALLDIIGFLRKFFYTLSHCIIYPSGLVEVVFKTYKPDLPAPANKLPEGQKYIGAFLFLIFSTIISFCFYRTKFFNKENKLTQGIRQKISSSIDYLTDVSLIKHLVACAASVFAIFVLAKIVTFIFKMIIRKEQEIFFIIKPLIYYFVGTIILIYIITDYIASGLHLRGASIDIDTINTFITAGYLIWSSYHVFSYLNALNLKKYLFKIFTPFVTTSLIVLSTLTIPFMVESSFKGILLFFDSLKYKGSITLAGTHYDNRIEGNIFKKGSQTWLTGQIILSNNSENIIYLLSDTVSVTIKDKEIGNDYSKILVLKFPDTSATTLPVIHKDESIMCSYEWEVNNAVIDKIKWVNPDSAAWINTEIKYAPRNLKERKKPIGLKMYVR